MSANQMQLDEILKEIIALPPDWHAAGSMSPLVLKAMVRHCSALDVSYSLETGSGKSTLLFSHLSPNHKVFAVDGGNGSVTKVLESPLLNRKSVTFIEGPTQQTLPKHHFEHKLQIALIDGPHGYPFPDIEYYHIYPHLEAGGILIVDDINIPTIHNLFRFLEADEMFSLIEVVKMMAFFHRTNALMFDPLGDGWWLQNYNTNKLQNRETAGCLKQFLPKSLRKVKQIWLKSLY